MEAIGVLRVQNEFKAKRLELDRMVLVADEALAQARRSGPRESNRDPLSFLTGALFLLDVFALAFVLYLFNN
jgi:hypothetical protein